MYEIFIEWLLHTVNHVARENEKKIYAKTYQ